MRLSPMQHQEFRPALATAIAECTPPVTLRATSGQFLEAFRSDPKIDEALSDLYRY